MVACPTPSKPGNGACDYLIKPVCFEKLEIAVEQVLRRAGELGKDTETLIGHSPAWEGALERARQGGAAGTPAPAAAAGRDGDTHSAPPRPPPPPPPTQ